jgi:hypothetical protein
VTGASKASALWRSEREMMRLARRDFISASQFPLYGKVLDGFFGMMMS